MVVLLGLIVASDFMRRMSIRKRLFLEVEEESTEQSYGASILHMYW
jgi:hypothetical protein